MPEYIRVWVGLYGTMRCCVNDADGVSVEPHSGGFGRMSPQGIALHQLLSEERQQKPVDPRCPSYKVPYSEYIESCKAHGIDPFPPKYHNLFKK